MGDNVNVVEDDKKFKFMSENDFLELLSEKDRIILLQEKDIGSLKREIKELQNEIEFYQNKKE